MDLGIVIGFNRILNKFLESKMIRATKSIKSALDLIEKFEINQ